MKIKTKADKERFFLQLLEICLKGEVYSVIELCLMAGVDHKEMKTWADTNQKWNYLLQRSRTICTARAETAGLFNRIPAKLAFAYISEAEHEQGTANEFF